MLGLSLSMALQLWGSSPQAEPHSQLEHGGLGCWRHRQVCVQRGAAGRDLPRVSGASFAPAPEAAATRAERSRGALHHNLTCSMPPGTEPPSLSLPR